MACMTCIVGFMVNLTVNQDVRFLASDVRSIDTQVIIQNGEE